jgi:hypothetical protein
MRKALIITNERAEYQKSWGLAFGEGLKRHGWAVEVAPEAGKRCDLLVMWSARRVDRTERQKARGGEVCVLERGYLDNRFGWTSVSFGGGLNGRAVFRGPFEDGSRWEKNFAHLMKPWRATKGDYALILQQITGDIAVENVNLPRFYQKASSAFSPYMNVRVRAHPNVNPRRHTPQQMAEARRKLGSDLAFASLAVTWNSNSGVDAVLAGIPTIAMDQGSMAWGVTGHELKPPPKPDRTAWARALAWKQWRREEMLSGDCWAAVGY